ncbi:hypothetical protein BV898_15586 [Hypsibius exemplaris]|uniref:G-protein coupled receptors family 1 profile domain-containing protein n=1 Tax=Hypsibius exemplaris TaxID=2072580 RepID=A0A9X6NI39_HYPEX|nr:hypothetical protein BV898_15586 [Hypsibius exemplaris]
MRGIFVISMATSDSLSMLLFLPKYLTVYAYYIGLPENTYPSNLVGHAVLTWLSYSFSHSSDLLIFLFSCERLLACRWPVYHKTLEQRFGVAILLVASVVVLGPLLRLQYITDRVHTHANEHVHLLCGRHKLVDGYDHPSWLLKWRDIDLVGRVALQVLMAIAVLCMNVWIVVILRSRSKRSSSTALCSHRGTVSVTTADVRLIGSSLLFIAMQFGYLPQASVSPEVYETLESLVLWLIWPIIRWTF